MSRQLQLVLELEQKKEDKLALQYGQASDALKNEQDRLLGLQNYRTEYIQQVHNTGQNGLSSAGFQRLQVFIGQLDKACGQQQGKIDNAEKVVQQRRALWLQQQRKRKSLEHLLTKQAEAKQQAAQKEEQKMLDEFAMLKARQQKVF
ncbi:flagellar export protein FliJ [Gayadomonas joobiniege]|uniref:flagellar export protein FliJ n=1 Tax=Gayadomonas joobiniege TaxID=1234606 RepID=UPI00035F6DBA|nr:flagellar export protein FliJ [Gayadomonas joobiniege]